MSRNVKPASTVTVIYKFNALSSSQSDFLGEDECDDCAPDDSDDFVTTEAKTSTEETSDETLEDFDSSSLDSYVTSPKAQPTEEGKEEFKFRSLRSTQVQLSAHLWPQDIKRNRRRYAEKLLRLNVEKGVSKRWSTLKTWSRTSNSPLP